MSTLNFLVALGTVKVLLASCALFVLIFLQKQYVQVRSMLTSIKHMVVPLLAVFSVFASVLTLYYSEVLGVIPCGLCWTERVFLYSSALILTFAAYRREWVIYPYVVLLSSCGALVSLYHHSLQMGGASLIPCPASGAGDCAKRILFEFGFVTFPLAAFALFIFITIVFLLYAQLDKTHTSL